MSSRGPPYLFFKLKMTKTVNIMNKSQLLHQRPVLMYKGGGQVYTKGLRTSEMIIVLFFDVAKCTVHIVFGGWAPPPPLNGGCFD